MFSDEKMSRSKCILLVPGCLKGWVSSRSTLFLRHNYRGKESPAPDSSVCGELTTLISWYPASSPNNLSNLVSPLQPQIRLCSGLLLRWRLWKTLFSTVKSLRRQLWGWKKKRKRGKKRRVSPSEAADLLGRRRKKKKKAAMLSAAGASWKIKDEAVAGKLLMLAVGVETNGAVGMISDSMMWIISLLGNGPWWRLCHISSLLRVRGQRASTGVVPQKKKRKKEERLHACPAWA